MADERDRYVRGRYERGLDIGSNLTTVLMSALLVWFIMNVSC